MELKNIIEIAVDVAQEAGKYLVANRLHNCNVLSQEGRDIKLQGDKDTEHLIRQKLAQTEIPIIGEEEGGDEGLLKKEALYWIVDPLDGTYNYLREQPQCCVSIGLMRGTEPILGVIYDFNTQEMYTGGKGIPLAINGQKVIPNWASTPSQGVLMTGFPTGHTYEQAHLLQFVERVHDFKKIRMNGSAALALAYVAIGRADAYCEEGIRLWDIAAGLALNGAAGAYIQLAPSNTGRFLAYDLWISPAKEWYPC